MRVEKTVVRGRRQERERERKGRVKADIKRDDSFVSVYIIPATRNICMYTCINSVVNRERFICESTIALLFFANPFRLRRLWITSAKILFNETNRGERHWGWKKFPRNETREGREELQSSFFYRRRFVSTSRRPVNFSPGSPFIRFDSTPVPKAAKHCSSKSQRDIPLFFNYKFRQFRGMRRKCVFFSSEIRFALSVFILRSYVYVLIEIDVWCSGMWRETKYFSKNLSKIKKTQDRTLVPRNRDQWE